MSDPCENCGYDWVEGDSMSRTINEQKSEIERLKAESLDFACWMSGESQIVSGCRDDYERGRYEAFRQALDRRDREAAKHE
jgi:hypothetical protein